MDSARHWVEETGSKDKSLARSEVKYGTTVLVSETLDGRQEYFLIRKFIPKMSWEGGSKVLLKFFLFFQWNYCCELTFSNG